MRSLLLTRDGESAIRRYGLLGIPLAYLLVFFFVPLALMLVISFWRVDNYHLVPAFTLGNYTEALTAPLNARVLWRTIELSIVVTVVAAAIGYPTAFFVARRVTRFRRVLIVLAVLPLWTSYLIRSFAWIPILSRNGVINQALLALGVTDQPVTWLLYSNFAVVVALVGVYLPYMILPCYAVLERLDGRLFEAADDLGASGAQTFWYVLLPLSAPGVAVGSLFVFIMAMGSYVTPALLGGTSGTLIGQRIAVQYLDLSNQPLGSAMSVVIMAIIVVLATLILRRYSLGGETR
ncbi:MAG TPA: ABC transporter permease [Alphaproteobacteria bacterium]|nr:ABC transporter permease [Alphaproteobacteria bacterium]